MTLPLFVYELLFHMPINRSLTFHQPTLVLLLRFPFFESSVFVLDQLLLCVRYSFTLALKWNVGIARC